MTAYSGARIVTRNGIVDDGWVEVVDGRITRVEWHSEPPAGGQPLGGGWLLPGFIDLHMHGGGGHDATASADDMAAAVAFHRSHGTTGTLVSLMAGPVDALCQQLEWIAGLAADGHVLGAHLEGPFLSADRCGAQNHRHLLTPDSLVLEKLLAAGQGAVRTVTIAPELPGALPVIEEIAASGAVAAIGHTNATYEEAAAGFTAGARLATHLFNAMGSMSQRAPGPAVAALDADAFVEVINDGVHVHEALTRLAMARAPGRVALITDAISATGVGDGRYTLGDQDVVVSSGEARLAGTNRLAGSTLTMDEAVRRAVHVVGLPIEVAATAAATTPARLLGIDDRCGAIAPGLDADLVLLDDDLRVRQVMARGRWLDAARSRS
jgi:N-acetylglucosamine-6-phosphate deacetylase